MLSLFDSFHILLAFLHSSSNQALTGNKIVLDFLILFFCTLQVRIELNVLFHDYKGCEL